MIGQEKNAAGNFEFYFYINEQEVVRTEFQVGRPPVYNDISFSYGFIDKREIRFRNITYKIPFFNDEL